MTNPDEINIVVKRLNKFHTANLGTGNLLKHCTTMLTIHVHLPAVCVCRTWLWKSRRTTNNLSKEFVLRVQGESRFQVSRKEALTLKFLFFALSNDLFPFVLWNSLKKGSRNLSRVNGAVQAHSLTKLSLFAQCTLYPATSGLVQAERLALKGEQGFIVIDHSVFSPEMRCIATY